MQKYFNYIETAHGFTLNDETDKYVLNRSKIYQNDYQFYLKKVEPTENFVSGLFRKKNKYVGRTMQGRKVEIALLNGGTCILSIY